MIAVRFVDPSIFGARPWSPRASNVYTCPTLVPDGAVDVKIKRYPDGDGDGPFEVQLPSQLGLAHPRPRPALGERVLVLLTSRDLLTLAVATVVAPGATPRARTSFADGDATDSARLNVRDVVTCEQHNEKGPGDATNVLGAQPGWRPQR